MFVIIANATVYECDKGDCVTTIIQYDGGYAWNIDCGDEQASGNVSGATYVGECEEQ